MQRHLGPGFKAPLRAGRGGAVGGGAFDQRDASEIDRHAALMFGYGQRDLNLCLCWAKDQTGRAIGLLVQVERSGKVKDIGLTQDE